MERNGQAFERIDVDIEEMRGWVVDFEVEHLVEIAVVEVSVPADGEGIAAHEAIDGSGIEGLDKCLHVLFVLAGL